MRERRIKARDENTIIDNMRYAELYRILRENGCYATSGKKHDKWYSPITGKKFPVPRHQSKEVAEGTLKKIMKEAGIKI